MKKVLITGSKGFIGSNLYINLRFTDGIDLYGFDKEDDVYYLKKTLKEVDFVFHLAGVNRPESKEDFTKSNTELTQFIVDYLIGIKRLIPIVFASSTQVTMDNDYGKSKLKAESHIKRYIAHGGSGYIYRFTNVFGKWCRPNYNSVVSTFCHNIANGLEISISNRSIELLLIHVDDIILDFKKLLLSDHRSNEVDFISINPSYKISLGELADILFAFKDLYNSIQIPDMGNDFIRKLHSTFLSYVPIEKAEYSLTLKTDDRGYIAELLKSKSMGQIFVSKTNPGITRGNHFHNQKNEKFCVIEGNAVIKFRHLISNKTHEFDVYGNNPVVVNILPGYVHSITNIGNNELITLFWANEPFDKEYPDTYFEKVEL